MPKSVYEQIKKQNGERFAKAIRGYDNGIFDIPGIVDIVKYAGREAEPIMEYLESLKKVHIEETGVYQDPLTLLDAAGYDAYYVTNLKEQNAIQKYYARGEELCTFRDPTRFERYHIINAVRKDVDQIRRKDFRGKEQREDEYGTSVLSIQILKKGGFISIKNRYNHTVQNPDNTLGSNPDNIIPGLSNALRHHFNVDFSAQRVFLPNGYTLIGGIVMSGYTGPNFGQRIIQYNYEKDNIYFGSNFYVKDGRIHHLESHEMMLNSYIFDMRTKKLVYPFSPRDKSRGTQEDRAFKEAFLKEIEGHKVIVKKEKDGQHLFIRKEGEKDPSKDIDILTVQDGEITSLTLPTVEKIEYNFLRSSKIKSFKAPALLVMCHECFSDAPRLETLELPLLRKLLPYCFSEVNCLKSVDLPELFQMDTGCFHEAQALKSVNLPHPSMDRLGHNCFGVVPALKSLNIPYLKILGIGCFNAAESIESVILPECVSMDSYSFRHTPHLKIFYAPLLKSLPEAFCEENPIKKMCLWLKRKQPPKEEATEKGISGVLRFNETGKSDAVDTLTTGISGHLQQAEKDKTTQNTSFFTKLRNWLLPQK